MEILFLGGLFTYDKQHEIIKKSKSAVNYAANEFQLKIIEGIEKNGLNIKSLSAPFIGAYPNRYKDIYFSKFKNDEKINYVSFINIWGIRNFSRAYSLKRGIKKFATDKKKEKVIVIYSPHTPFLEAAIYAKKYDPKIHICLIVPDLPQYMNLESGNKLIYNFFKKFDIKRFNNLKNYVDSFVLLTEQMKDILCIENKPYTVVEGMVNIDDIDYKNNNKLINNTKSIVYTGTLNEKFGVLNLVRAFQTIQYEDIELIICGDGETRMQIEQISKDDTRIKFLGQVNIEKSKRLQKDAWVLVNPRQNNEEYTKYSFPSKTMEYLVSGNPVIAYKLDGIPREYEEYLYYVKDNSIEGLANSIIEAINIRDDIRAKRKEKTISFLRENKTNEKRCKEILSMIKENIK